MQPLCGESWLFLSEDPVVCEAAMIHQRRTETEVPGVRAPGQMASGPQGGQEVAVSREVFSGLPHRLCMEQKSPAGSQPIRQVGINSEAALCWVREDGPTCRILLESSLHPRAVWQLF